MPIQIEEIIRRSEQGITLPFICRGEDGEIYFVKGRSAGRRSQIAEWIAGQLCLALDLPIAPFSLVDVPEKLVAMGGALQPKDLGEGLAFGSLRQDSVMELTTSVIHQIPVELQQDVLIFDWWINNGDRLLTAKGGNPNLFWEPQSQALVIIDHNQAFADDVEPLKFTDLHVFAEQWNAIAGDLLKRQAYNQRFSAVLEDWDSICASIPETWWYADPEMTVAVDFDLNKVYEFLKRHERDDFWSTL